MRRRVALSTSGALVLAATLALAAQVKDLHPTELATFTPVTEQMLRNPPPGDWLNWRRTDNNWGYSTLTEINKENVQQMQLAWSWAMDDTGANEAVPIVHDGIMYLPIRAASFRRWMPPRAISSGSIVPGWRRPRRQEARIQTVGNRRASPGNRSVLSQRPPAAAEETKDAGFKETSRCSATGFSGRPMTRTSLP